LEDETSPGEIDDDEANWLLAKIQGDGQLYQNDLYFILIIIAISFIYNKI